QQRRLFPSERVARSEDSSEKVDRLTAKAIAVRDKRNEGHSYALNRIAGEWLLSEPYRDVPNPDRLKSTLTTLPEVWAERFVDKPDADLSKYGLQDPPEHTLSVTKPDGQTGTLVIGKESRREKP